MPYRIYKKIYRNSNNFVLFWVTLRSIETYILWIGIKSPFLFLLSNYEINTIKTAELVGNTLNFVVQKPKFQELCLHRRRVI